MKVLRRWFLIFLLLSVSLFSVSLGYYFTVTKDATLSPERLLLSQKNVVVYDGDGARVKNVSAGTARGIADIGTIPQATRFAFVDTEDKRFFSHNGFDVRRIAKAALNNVRSRSFKEGASTISQQLIKNTHLSQEKTFKRKLREWKLTKALERAYTKEEILEKYLNVIYFGHNCFGIRSAAEFYFGKQPQELDLADSAILAGLVKSPNNYSPFKNADNCIKRKETVLSLMLKNGHISQREKRAAMEKPRPTAPAVRSDDLGYLHFVFDELSAIAETQGFTVGGNIEIFTYLDPPLQEKLQEIAATCSNTDVTATVLDVKNHGFKGCISTVGEVRRLPGSLLKPLLVYAPALEKNLLSPATPILDEQIDYGGYAPTNFDGTFRGYVSVREALADSLNVPAVKILETVGVKTGASYLEKMRLPIEKEDLSLALALGGMKNGYSLQKLVSAYATFPSGGAYTDGAFISEIRIDGARVYKREIKQTRVFSEETAYLTTDMLRTAAKTGTAKKLRSLPFEIAAKTGTVGTRKGNTDAYALSYTPRDCVGVWLGNADNSFIDCTGGGTPCNLLLAVNEYLHQTLVKQNRALEKFPVPNGVVRVALDKTSYYDTHTLSLADEKSPVEYRFTELFKKTAIPAKTSDFFSNPSIISPVLQYKDGKVVIRFDDKSPAFYQYKIERYDYATHNTLYFGEYIKEYTDERIEPNKNYVYTVTPIFQKTQGKPIVLPAVSTKYGESPTANDGEILKKNWWEY